MPKKDKYKIHKEIKQETVRRKKTDSEVFWDLRTKLGDEGLAKELGRKLRTLRSYYWFFSGKDKGDNDRTPPKEVIDKFRKLAKKKRMRITTDVTLKGYTDEVRGDELLSKARRTNVVKTIKSLGKKYKGIIARVGLRIYDKSSGMVERWLTIVIQYNKIDDVLEQIQDEINSILEDYRIMYFEVFHINLQIIQK